MLQSIPYAGHGVLGVAQWPDHVPFKVHRTFYVYGAPEGTCRADHAHRKQEQFLICLAGAVSFEVEHRKGKLSGKLSSPEHALYIPPMCWVRLLINQTATVYVVLASGRYDESDYIRDRAEFETLILS